MIPEPIDFLLMVAFNLEREKLQQVFEKSDECKTEKFLNLFDQGDEDRLQVKRYSVTSGLPGYQNYSVVVIQPKRICRVPAAVALRVALTYWHPSYVVLVGIAGAFQGSGLDYGDVVIPEYIQDYERATLEKDPARRIRTFETNATLRNKAPKSLSSEQVAKFLSAETQKLLKDVALGGDLLSRKAFNVVNEGIAISGDKKIRDTTPQIDDVLASAGKDLKCVEMEAGGVGEACEWNDAAPRRFLMIRGISDIVGADSKTDPRKNEKQELAAASACYAAFKLISEGRLQPHTQDSGNPPFVHLPRPIVMREALQAFNDGFPLMYVGNNSSYKHLACQMSSSATDLVVWVANGSPLRSREMERWDVKGNFLEDWDQEFEDLKCKKARLVIFTDEEQRSEYCQIWRALKGSSHEPVNLPINVQRIAAFEKSCGEHLYYTSIQRIKQTWEEFQPLKGLDVGFVSWTNPHSRNPVTYCFCSPFTVSELSSESRVAGARRIMAVFETRNSEWVSSLRQEKSPLWQAWELYDKVVQAVRDVVRHSERPPEWLAKEPAAENLDVRPPSVTVGGR